MALFLGIDAGGTTTMCVVGSETAVLATAAAGGSNIVRVGETEARHNLQAAIRDTCAAAGVAPEKIAAACIGAAGVSASDVAEKLRAFISEVVPGLVDVVGDMVIAMEAAFGSGPGVIVISGTGSIAFGRNERGETARAGGWGYAVSDEGSGHWIGRMAVSACLRAWDSGLETALSAHLVKAWQTGGRDEVVREANACPPPDFAELFPYVVAAAEVGDATARGILTQAGMELAQLAKIVVRRFWSVEQPVQVAMVGGVFQNSATVRRAFLNSVQAGQPGVSVIPETIKPALGALALARKAMRRTRQTGT
jgi:N-acetylglucosamine kinase-like BadF-type ATPase